VECLLARALLGCILAWLLQRRSRAPAADEPRPA
jgi:hypothetical protein